MKTRTIDLCLIGFVLVLIILASGCHRPPQAAVKDSVRTVTVRETIHDTTILIEQDSSWIQYYIDCQEGKAKLTELLSYRPGENIRPPQVIIKDRILTAKCNVDSFAVYAAFKSRDTTTTTTTSQVIVKQVNYLTGWQWVQVYAGRLLLALVLLYVGYLIVKRYTGLKLPP